MLNKDFRKEINKILEEYFILESNPNYISKKIDYIKYFEDSYKKSKPVMDFVSNKLRFTSLSFSDLVIIVVGGADGSEIFSVLINTPIKYGILMEYDTKSCDKARKTWKTLRNHLPKKQLLILEGDATTNINKVRIFLNELYDQNKIKGIIISCQSVLHELPFRSIKDYNQYKFLLSIIQDSPNTFFHCKEPIGLIEYTGEVQLRIPIIELNKLFKFSMIVKERLAFSGEIIKGVDFISLDGRLAGEVIKKLVYLAKNLSPDSLHTEVEESHSAFDSEVFYNDVICKLFHPNTSSLEYVNSETFKKYFLDLNIIIRSVTNNFPSGIIPKAFVIITAWRIDNPKLNPPYMFCDNSVFFT